MSIRSRASEAAHHSGLALAILIPAVLIALATATILFTYPGGGTDRIRHLTIDFPTGGDPACVYDPVDQSMTVLIHITAKATKPVDLTVTASVIRDHLDADRPKQVRHFEIGHETLDHTERFKVPLSTAMHKGGWTKCVRQAEINRGEPWD